MELAGWLRIWLRLSSSAKVPLGAIGDGSFSRFAFLRLASLE